MGLLDGVLGGLVGGSITTLVEGVIAQHGGVQGLVEQFEKGGMGGLVQSWVGTGTNLPISADQLHQVLGSDTVKGLAAKLGIDPQEMLQKLSAALPDAVDKMTPDGTVAKG